MKNLKNIALILLPATMICFSILWEFGNEKYIYHLFTEEGISPTKIFEVIKYCLYEIMTLLYVIAPVVYFSSTDQGMKNKVYSLLRYCFIISFLFAIPNILLYLSRGVQFDSLRLWAIPFRYAIFIFISIVFWTVKPDDAVPPITLSDHHMVAYTTTGHRFLHHIVDTIFFYSITFKWTDSRINEGLSPLETAIVDTLFSTLLMSIYYFISEAMFRQTLGKILTGSCTVAVDKRMSTGLVLKRTLCRLIPFDSFSFLSGRNWHDKVSGTAVVYQNSWEDIEFEGERQ